MEGGNLSSRISSWLENPGDSNDDEVALSDPARQSIAEAHAVAEEVLRSVHAPSQLPRHSSVGSTQSADEECADTDALELHQHFGLPSPPSSPR